jgi:hypothetical protein
MAYDSFDLAAQVQAQNQRMGVGTIPGAAAPGGSPYVGTGYDFPAPAKVVPVPVPGQNHQQIMPAQPPAKYMHGLPDNPQEWLRRAPPAPVPAPNVPPGRPAPGSTAPAPASTGRMSGLRSGVGDTMAGLAGDGERKGKLGALASGFTGAQESKRSREERKREQTEREDEKLYQRGRDSVADRRADSADARADNADRRAASADARDARMDALNEVKADVGVRQSLLDLRQDAAEQGFSANEVNSIQRNARQMTDDYFGDDPPDDPEEYKEVQEGFFHQLLEQHGGVGGKSQDRMGNGEPPAPGHENPSQTVREPGGDGTWEAPIQFPKGGAIDRNAIVEQHKRTGKPVYWYAPDGTGIQMYP